MIRNNTTVEHHSLKWLINVNYAWSKTIVNSSTFYNGRKSFDFVLALMKIFDKVLPSYVQHIRLLRTKIIHAIVFVRVRAFHGYSWHVPIYRCICMYVCVHVESEKPPKITTTLSIAEPCVRVRMRWKRCNGVHERLFTL